MQAASGQATRAQPTSKIIGAMWKSKGLENDSSVAYVPQAIRRADTFHSEAGIKVCHEYTKGWIFPHHTWTCTHCTCAWYTLIPTCKSCGVLRYHTIIIIKVCLFSPYKALGPDKIPNIVLMKCIDVLIDHLFFIFRAIFELNIYHPMAWVNHSSFVKIGKTAYNIAKSYCPIGLVDTIPKVFLTLCTKHTYLIEKHNLLPPLNSVGAQVAT